MVFAEPGDLVVAETDDFAAGQIQRDSPASALLDVDFDLIYPLAGPIHVAGAEPGDALAIEIVGFELPGGGKQFLRIHASDKRFPHRIRYLEQDFAVAFGLDQVPHR